MSKIRRNKEQTDSNQRGAGDNWGKKRKGHQGTCIKDPWTKPKGGRTEYGSC